MVIVSGHWEFFDEENFKGTKHELGPGVYLKVQERGINDNSISSIRLVSPRGGNVLRPSPVRRERSARTIVQRDKGRGAPVDMGVSVSARPRWSFSVAGGPIMIMRITWGKLRAGTWAEYEQAYHATVAGKTVPGLRGRWLAQDVNDPDGGFSVSLWDSLDAMQAYEQSAVFTQEIQPTLQPFFAGEYTTYRCDVKYDQ